MPLNRELVACGLFRNQAGAATGSVATGLTAAGNSQATALLLRTAINCFGTVGASTGCRLPAGCALGDSFVIYNGGSNTLNIFPPTGGAINGASANAAATLAAGDSATVYCTAASGLVFFAVSNATSSAAASGEFTTLAATGTIAGGSSATLGAAGGTTGSVVLAGATSGTATITTSATGATVTVNKPVAVTGMVTGTTGVGYATGVGGAVTQATNKGTGVTLSKVCGQITTHNAELAAGAEVGFTVTNTAVAATDVVVACISSGGTAASYTLTVDAVAAGSFKLSLSNVSAGNLSEALVINFAVIKAVAA